ncbi:endophilin-A-like isoform X6 [Argiope bruennichi]|uniref:Endophilin-A n=1 Tax=Argiope bruennichi TaxID=94029 RepID=A0A8T0E385_ARGBR|nr:endophilin-A-like isoform X6 [Argiope bruennichi]KAF8764351.1 Endophilin-A like protein [Argiope bruennichi]
MAFAGLKKQINKANQYMSEKIGGAEGTKFTEEYTEMERKTDLTNELVEDLLNKTKEYLQPNPASRAKLMVSSKLRGGAKAHAYTQPEGTLGESMVKYGKDLGEESPFGLSLIECGEALKQMAEVKYALEDNVKQNFLEPLHHLQTKDIKDVMHHRKKLQGRRLDYDCKKRRQAKRAHLSEEEIKLAEDKFEESFNLASMGMFNLLENDVEQISQLASLAESLYDYHNQCAAILQSAVERLNEQRNEAASRPRETYQPKKLHELNIPSLHDDISPQVEYGASPARSPAGTPVDHPPHKSLFLGGLTAGGGQTSATSPGRSPNRSPNASPLPSPVRSPARTPVVQQPCAQALYDFEPENEGELGFKEGEVITLTSRVDDNWFEGTIHNRTGLFPVNYVQVLVPLP